MKEADTREFCPYCCLSLSDKRWNISHNLTVHYRSAKCDCGKTLTLKFDRISSGGTDSSEAFAWSSAPEIPFREAGSPAAEDVVIRTLEHRIKIVKEYEKYNLQRDK